MKKLLVAVLAFALFAPAFAVENIQITGDIQTIGLRLENGGVAKLGRDQRGTSNRVLFGIGADLVEDVRAQLTFAHRYVHGEYTIKGEPITGGNSFLNRTFIAEAYVNISNVFDALEVKVGRQFYGDEKSAVMYFGPDYGYAIANRYTSLDGVTAKYNGENLTVTAAYFTLWNVDGNFNPVSRDSNIGGLDLNYKFNEQVSASAYVYDSSRYADFGFWGVKPTFENDNVKLGAEFARNYGSHDKGWLVKADLALPVAIDDTTLTPRVTYLKSEKGFEAYGNYRPGLMFGTLYRPVNSVINPDSASMYPLSENNGRWEIINAGLCMKFASLEKWGFGLDFYTGELNGVFNGNSWEAKVVYNHNEYVAFNLTGAVLSNVKHFTASPTAVQLGMNIKF